jgi:hypothetical protein
MQESAACMVGAPATSPLHARVHEQLAQAHAASTRNRARIQTSTLAHYAPKRVRGEGLEFTFWVTEYSSVPEFTRACTHARTHTSPPRGRQHSLVTDWGRKVDAWAGRLADQRRRQCQRRRRRRRLRRLAQPRRPQCCRTRPPRNFKLPRA